MNIYDRDTLEIQKGHGAKIALARESRTYRIETNLIVANQGFDLGKFVPTEADVTIYRNQAGDIEPHSNVALKRIELDGPEQIELTGYHSWWLDQLDDAPLAVRQIWDYDQSLRAAPIDLGGDAA